MPPASKWQDQMSSAQKQAIKYLHCSLIAWLGLNPHKLRWIGVAGWCQYLKPCHARNLLDFRCKFYPPPQFRLHICSNDNQIPSFIIRFGWPVWVIFFNFSVFRNPNVPGIGHSSALSTLHKGFCVGCLPLLARMTAWIALWRVAFYICLRIFVRPSGCWPLEWIGVEWMPAAFVANQWHH